MPGRPAPQATLACAVETTTSCPSARPLLLLPGPSLPAHSPLLVAPSLGSAPTTVAAARWSPLPRLTTFMPLPVRLRRTGSCEMGTRLPRPCATVVCVG